MDTESLKRFYLENKTTLDTRLGLVVPLLALICRKLEPLRVGTGNARGHQKTPKLQPEQYMEFDLLYEQNVASIHQIEVGAMTLSGHSHLEPFGGNDGAQYSYSPIRYESTAVIGQSRWYI